MDERSQSGPKVEKRISFVKDEELAPIPENTALSKEATEFKPTIEDDEESDLNQPHVLALYEYFGPAVAEDFLHPRMDSVGGSTGARAPELLQKRERTNQSIVSNSTDVDSLWSNLRQDSQLRLTRRDARINDRLKKAYNAFARQCLARRERPPERSFAPRDDLDELSHLISTSQVANVQKHRRRKELMFRQAQVHENQFRILEHNNPLPDLNNRSGVDAIASYVPSWNTSSNQRDGQEEEEEEEEEEEKETTKRQQPTKPSLGELAFDSMVLQSSYHRPPSYTTKRYRFLGDREYEPTFRARIKEQCSSLNDPIEAMLRQAKDRKQRASEAGPNAQRALPGFALRRRSAHLGAGGAAVARAAAEGAVEANRLAQRHGHSAPTSARALSWEPLSLGALIDYKKSRGPTLTSQRPFRGGSVPWWSLEEARV